MRVPYVSMSPKFICTLGAEGISSTSNGSKDHEQRNTFY